MLAITFSEMLCDNCGERVYHGYSTAPRMKGKLNYYHMVRGSTAGYRQCKNGKRTSAACKS